MNRLQPIVSKHEDRDAKATPSKGLVAWIIAHPRRLLLLCLLLSCLALWPAANLRFETDLLSLLPTGSPAADGYRAFEEHFGGAEKVFVLIRLRQEASGSEEAAETAETSDPTALVLAAAEHLRLSLAKSPEVAAIRGGIEAAEEAFFLDHVVPRAPLLISGEWRQTLRRRLRPDAIRQRASHLRASLSGPGGGLRAELLTRDPLGFMENLPELQPGAATLPIDPLTLSFLSAGGDSSLLILTPARSELDPEAGRALEAVLEKCFGETREAISPELEFHPVGGPLYAAQDERILRTDLQRTITGSMIGCTLLLLAAFEGFLLPAAALGALAIGLLWTAGWMGLALTPISATGVGFAAVLVGLGIDYSIHGGACFRQQRLAGESPTAALASTFRHAGPALLTSALTTATAFSILGLAHFRPLRELGLVVAGGILAILLATATVGSALLLLPRKQRQTRPPAAPWRLLGRISHGLVGLGEQHPRFILGMAALLSLAGLWGVQALRLDTDPAAFRPQDHPAREAERRLVENFDLGLDTTTLVIVGQDLDQALTRAAAASQILEEHLGPGLDLSTPTRWLRPKVQIQERLAAAQDLPFAEAADLLAAELGRVGLAAIAFEPGLSALRALGRGEDPAPVSPSLWPPGVEELLRREEGATYAALRLRLPEGSWRQGPPDSLIKALRLAAPGIKIASVPAIGAELGTLARHDLRTLSLLALLGVGLVVLVSFRASLLASTLAMVPVLLGSLWTLGLWGLMGRSIDLLSLAVVPIMLGIGIDDGLHALHGSGPRAAKLGESVRQAARAMTLTSLTTCVGFGSLTLSRVPGLANGGLLVALGVAACLFATLLVLPALAKSLPNPGRRRLHPPPRGD